MSEWIFRPNGSWCTWTGSANTAAASIPLALDHAAGAGDLFPGARVVLAAFGGGATWGATALTWPVLK